MSRDVYKVLGEKKTVAAGKEVMKRVWTSLKEGKS